MGAIRITSWTTEDCLAGHTMQLPSHPRSIRRGLRPVPRDHRSETVSELAESPRMRGLAKFLDCDPEAVAGGLLDAVTDDPLLRVRRL